MKAKILGYTVEVHISRDAFSRWYADKLLAQSLSYRGGHKIALIKALRIEQDISLVDAKKAIESMFDFDSDGKPTIK